MDDLLSIATKALEGFNPATDTVDDFEKLPDGEYNCLLEDVMVKKSETTGNNWISFKFSIMNGEYANRLIFANYFFTDKTAGRNSRRIKKIAYGWGYELAVDAFGSLEALAETLKAMAGNQAMVKQITSKNGYTDHDVTPVA